MTQPIKVHHRVYLTLNSRKGQQLVIEYVSGYCEAYGVTLDEYRLIDLLTGKVFAKDEELYTVFAHASKMIQNEGRHRYTYVPEKPIKLKTFDELPLKDKLRHVESLAHDLEHDFRLEGNNHCPLETAINDYHMRYNTPCFYQESNGNWELFEEP